MATRAMDLLSSLSSGLPLLSGALPVSSAYLTYGAYSSVPGRVRLRHARQDARLGAKALFDFSVWHSRHSMRRTKKPTRGTALARRPATRVENDSWWSASGQ